MNINTEDQALEELYKNGKTQDKKYKNLPLAAIKGYIKAVNHLKAANRIEDLYRINSLHYEKLKGNRTNQESVRCTDSWRLIFHSSPIDGSLIITEICLIEITHHYE